MDWRIVNELTKLNPGQLQPGFNLQTIVTNGVWLYVSKY